MKSEETPKRGALAMCSQDCPETVEAQQTEKLTSEIHHLTIIGYGSFV